jgi:hypothetical protein
VLNKCVLAQPHQEASSRGWQLGVRRAAACK